MSSPTRACLAGGGRSVCLANAYRTAIGDFSVSPRKGPRNKDRSEVGAGPAMRRIIGTIVALPSGAVFVCLGTAAFLGRSLIDVAGRSIRLLTGRKDDSG